MEPNLFTVLFGWLSYGMTPEREALFSRVYLVVGFIIGGVLMSAIT